MEMFRHMFLYVYMMKAYLLFKLLIQVCWAVRQNYDVAPSAGFSQTQPKITISVKSNTWVINLKKKKNLKNYFFNPWSF